MKSVPEFYAGQNIFMTGATGFIGKVLIEKLLRSCPEVGAIYCLIRPKRGVSAHERLQKLLGEQLYDKLREEHPNFPDKVHAIQGDVQEDGLGVQQSDAELLQSVITVVFHSAALVKFDETLRLALDMNVLGTQRMVKLAKEFKHLQAFVYVSTAYSNCDRKHIDEIIYPPPVDPHKIIDAMEWMTDDMVNTAQVIGKSNKPNTYTYTKALAETLLVQEGGDLPMAVVRPSIVTATWKEPVPGWVDNMNGPTGLNIAAGKGIMRSLIADPDAVADFIPVDMSVNLLIAAAWYLAESKPGKVQVYNITTGSVNPCSWGAMRTMAMNWFQQNPLEDCYRRPKFVITRSRFIYDYWVLVSHLLPAYIVDMGMRCIGRKPRMVRIYEKVHKTVDTMQYFTQRSWGFTYSNTDALRAAMNSRDQKSFYFDPRALDWLSYIETYCMGQKHFVLKEEMSGIPAARAHLKKLRNIVYAFNTIIIILLWRYLATRYKVAHNTWMLFIGLGYKRFMEFFRKIRSTKQRD